MATSHVNEAVSKIRLEPFIREVRERINGTVRVLCKARLIFSRINGPNVYITALCVIFLTKLRWPKNNFTFLQLKQTTVKPKHSLKLL